VRIFLGRDAKGKQLFHRKTIHGTKKDAETYRNKVARDRDMGTFIEPAALAVKDYLDKWLKAAARPRLRERTYEDYSELLKRYVRPLLGDKRLCDVRPLDIQNLYAALTDRGLSARTVRYTHAILSSAFKQALKWHMLIYNPCEAVELPRAERREMQAFGAKEGERFLKAAKGNEQGVVFAFALATGMRPEEYLGLKWSDLDLQQGTAIVQRVLIRRKGGGWYFGEPKTSRSRRTVPLPTTLVKMLIAHRRKQMAARLKAGVAYKNNDLVFATGEGTPHNSRNLAQRQFQAILKKAELPLNFRLYDLRHSCATLLLMAGENPKVVSERLGHASVVLTLDTYSHVLPSMQQAATEKLERMLFSR
jgi:integrase